MPNPLDIYTAYDFLNTFCWLCFLNEPELILLCTVKWFQVLLCITNNSFKYQSFVHTQLNDQTVLFQRIQFSMTDFVCTLCWMPNSSIWPIDRTLTEWTWEQCQWRGTLHSPKLQYYSNLTIGWFSALPGESLEAGVSPLCREAVDVFLQPQPTGLDVLVMALNNTWWVEYSFIDITPKPTLNRSGCICFGPIYWSTFVGHLMENHLCEKVLVLFNQNWKMKGFLFIRLIGIVGRVFANGPGDLGSIPGLVTSKTF